MRAILIASVLMLALFSILGYAGEKAPMFTLPDISNKKVKLGDVLAEKGCVLIDFWELSCFSCKQAFPKYEEIYKKYKDQGLEILAISVDSVKSVSNVGPYVSGVGVTFRVLLDTNNDVFQAYHVQMMPTCFLVDWNGNIRYTHTGYKPGDEKEIEEQILKVLEDYAKAKEEE